MAVDVSEDESMTSQRKLILELNDLKAEYLMLTNQPYESSSRKRGARFGELSFTGLDSLLSLSQAFEAIR